MIIMRDKKSLLDQRIRLKKKKPTFTRKNWNAKGKIEKNVWRKARGCDNKQRIHKKGAPTKPSQGYRAPAEVRGLHHSGLIPMVVCNIKRLVTLSKEYGIIVSGKMGDKKRKELIAACQKQGLTIINFDAQKQIVKIDKTFNDRKEAKKQRDEQSVKSEKEKKSIEEKLKKETEKKAAEQAKKEAVASTDEAVAMAAADAEEEKRKQEKEDKDKLLTKRI